MRFRFGAAAFSPRQTIRRPDSAAWRSATTATACFSTRRPGCCSAPGPLRISATLQRLLDISGERKVQEWCYWMVCSKLLLRIDLFSLQNPGVSAKVPHCYSALREAPQIWCRLGARKANPCRNKVFAKLRKERVCAKQLACRRALRRTRSRCLAMCLSVRFTAPQLH